jgi:predicted dehydrogenase
MKLEVLTPPLETSSISARAPVNPTSPKSIARIAVIGAGWWGTEAHIPAVKRHPAAELAAVQSQDPDRTDKIAQDFGATHACSTVEETLAIKSLDAVIISSTPNVHYSQARAALLRDLHVLVEKPMTIRAEESRELVALAEKRNLHFLVSCPWHYTAHSIEARRLIQCGALGDLKMISVCMSNFVLGLYKGQPWEEIFGRSPTRQNSARPYRTPRLTSYSDPAIAGGGQIYSQMSHVAAHLGFITGRKPTRVYAQMGYDGAVVDVYNTLNLTLEDQCLVSIASSGAIPSSERHYELRVYGTKGLLMMELWKGTMELHLNSGEVKRYPDLEGSQIYPMFDPATNLVDLALGRGANGSPGSLGYYALRIIEGACESAKTQQPVRLVP